MNDFWHARSLPFHYPASYHLRQRQRRRLLSVVLLTSERMEVKSREFNLNKFSKQNFLPLLLVLVRAQTNGAPHTHTHTHSSSGQFELCTRELCITRKCNGGKERPLCSLMDKAKCARVWYFSSRRRRRRRWPSSDLNHRQIALWADVKLLIANFGGLFIITQVRECN